MYKVEIHVQEKGRKEKKETFVIGDIDSSAYHDEMNAVSDYLYGLDIPFDVDADGDMMIDDILISLSEEEDFEQSFTAGKTTYLVQGRKRISMEAFYAAMYHKLSAYTTKSFIYRGMNT